VQCSVNSERSPATAPSRGRPAAERPTALNGERELRGPTKSGRGRRLALGIESGHGKRADGTAGVGVKLDGVGLSHQ
jgi:hypothetical protein